MAAILHIFNRNACYRLGDFKGILIIRNVFHIKKLKEYNKWSNYFQYDTKTVVSSSNLFDCSVTYVLYILAISGFLRGTLNL